jgi:hypothetical protein
MGGAYCWQYVGRRGNFPRSTEMGGGGHTRLKGKERRKGLRAGGIEGRALLPPPIPPFLFVFMFFMFFSYAALFLFCRREKRTGMWSFPRLALLIGALSGSFGPCFAVPGASFLPLFFLGSFLPLLYIAADPRRADPPLHLSVIRRYRRYWVLMAYFSIMFPFCFLLARGCDAHSVCRRGAGSYVPAGPRRGMRETVLLLYSCVGPHPIALKEAAKKEEKRAEARHRLTADHNSPSRHDGDMSKKKGHSNPHD